MVEAISRRDFMQKGSIVVAGAALMPRRAAASDRVRLGIIGTANRGGQLIAALSPHPDAEIVAFCDVHGQALKEWKESFPNAEFYGDYRRILERPDIDAVVIATPDHWHALQTIAACDAGKDVYIEKPLSLKVVEGRRMVEAARRNNRVVQTGLHRRSLTLFRELSEQLDWEMWIGPQQMRPFQENIAPYKFRWWKDYSSQLGNWGVHYFDLIRWLIGETAPVSVVAMGGRYAVEDDRTIPDTMQSVFELPSGCLLTFSHYEASGNFPLARPGEIEIRGTQGTLYASEKGYEVVPERGGQFMDRAPRMEPVQKKSEDGDLTVAHMRNFLDCIKTRNRPCCDVEDGHLSTTFAHLANISLDTRLRLDWDAAAERITNHEQANQLLQYEYRPPWTLA